jgi:hypothetical protein
VVVSPVSRRRKKPRSRRVVRPVVNVAQECACPECAGAEFDPAAYLDELTADASELLDAADPLEAELFGATVVAAGQLVGEGAPGRLPDSIVPALTRSSTPESVAVLLAIDAVGGDAGAGEAARRLIETGIAGPGWAGELSAPMTAEICRRYADPVGEVSMLLGGFSRAGRSHGFILEVDHADCDAAVYITLVPGDLLDQAADVIMAEARETGVTLLATDLEPGEFRRQVERALDARAVHDLDAVPVAVPGADDDIELSYRWLAVLLRSRMRAFPGPARPAAPHGSGAGPGT